MTSYEKQKDTERGTPKVPSGPTPSERFLLFRDLTFGKYSLGLWHVLFVDLKFSLYHSFSSCFCNSGYSYLRFPHTQHTRTLSRNHHYWNIRAVIRATQVIAFYL